MRQIHSQLKRSSVITLKGANLRTSAGAKRIRNGRIYHVQHYRHVIVEGEVSTMPLGWKRFAFDVFYDRPRYKNW